MAKCASPTAPRSYSCEWLLSGFGKSVRATLLNAESSELRKLDFCLLLIYSALTRSFIYGRSEIKSFSRMIRKNVFRAGHGPKCKQVKSRRMILVREPTFYERSGNNRSCLVWICSSEKPTYKTAFCLPFNINANSRRQRGQISKGVNKPPIITGNL